MSTNITAFSDTMQCSLVYMYPTCAKVHSARSKKTVLVALVLHLSALTSFASIHFLIYALSFSVYALWLAEIYYANPYLFYYLLRKYRF